MLNHVVLIGRVATEPELKYLQSGVPCCTFRLAVDRSYRDASGERQTDFIDIVCWRKQAEVAANYLGLGRLISIQGSLQIHQWVAQDGTKRRNAQIVSNELRFLDPSKGSARADMEDTPQEQMEAPPEAAPAKRELVSCARAVGQPAGQTAASFTDDGINFEDPFAED